MEKGKVYEMQYLTDTEKEIINALRSGADIEIWFRDIKNIDSAIDQVVKFSPVASFNNHRDHITVTNWSVTQLPNPTVYVQLDKE